MSSCIVVLYLGVYALTATGESVGTQRHVSSRWLKPVETARAGADTRVLLAAPSISQDPGAPNPNDDPDALYASREEPGKAKRALDLWSERLAHGPSDFEAAWKAARALYWLGTHGPEDARRRDLEAGIDVARTASTLQPNRPEGYFWLAAHMGALAESFGVRQGLKYRKPIKEALEHALAIDPAYLGGAPDRAIGRWYFKVPGLFGGSNDKSVDHLRKALTYNPNSTVTLYFLAETLLDIGRKEEARVELQKVLSAPLDPDWAPEDREWKARAKALLSKIR